MAYFFFKLVPPRPSFPQDMTEAEGATNGGAPQPPPQPTTLTPGAAKPRSFHGTAEVPAATAKMRFVQLADEIVSILNSDPSAAVKLVVEISADFPEGATDTVKRAVSESARTLGLKSADWE